MPKVYLSPAYHRQNNCSIAGCFETKHNNEYMDALEPFLMACGIEFKRGPRRTPMSGEDGTALMKQAVAESNAWGADIHYISHTNASSNGVGTGKAQGCRPIICKGSARGEKLGAIMVRYRKEVYPRTVTLNRRTDLYELTKPAAVSFYEEHVFHDNMEDAQWFHAHMRDVARSAAKGFCEYFGIPYVEPSADVAQEAPAETVAPDPDGGWGLPVLSKGDTGASVKALQALLNGYGYTCGAVDGDFGAKTDAAVRNYQSANSLVADGVVGKATWARLLGV